MLRCSKAFGLLSAVSSFVEFAASNTFTLWQAGLAAASGTPQPLAVTPAEVELRQTHVNYVRFFVILPIMIGLAMLRDLKDVARIMNLGVIAAVVNGGAIVVGG